MFQHPGIRIDHIVAEGGGGLIFALGTVLIFWLGFPAFRPLVLASLIGGPIFALVFHRLGH